MKSKRVLMLAMYVALSSVAGSGIARAQHLDVLTLQVAGQLVTGTANCADANCDTGQWTLGQRVFSNEFPESGAVDKPGFNALANGAPGMPAGAQALPGGAALSWDFLPMAINGVSRNLFYWNGQETDGVAGITPDDVAFGPPPGPNYLFSLFDQANAKFSVNGSNDFVAGGSLGNTNADGSFHKHRFFFLEDGDGMGGTSPADGIYLAAIHMRMTGLAHSLPVFLVFGTSGSSIAALDDAAVPWVEEQLSLSGDYNQNGVVDTADYAVWRRSLVTQAVLPNETASLNVVDQGDYVEWRRHFGQAAELLAGAGVGSMGNARAQGVPEPATWVSLVLGAVGCCLRRRRAA